MHQRILCSLPALPDRNTGGGVLLYETLLYLLTRGTVDVVVPVARHLTAAFSELASHAEFAGIRWHPICERAQANALGRLRRLISPLPAEVFKFATARNQATLAKAREQAKPTAELLISSRALAPYPTLSALSASRLYMMDIEPRIVRYTGPSARRRLASRIEHPKVLRWCGRALAAAGRVGAISAADVAELNQLGHRSDVRHVPPLLQPRPTLRDRVDAFHVLITTNFSYPPNVIALDWFLRECWPHVDPRSRLTVTGLDTGDSLRRLCDAHPRVSYAGCLPREELDALFGRVALAVNPTRTGSGFQIKLLEAIARGVPIVSTAFSNRIGAAIASSDDPVELADLINARLTPGVIAPFDYGRFHADAVAAWDRFLFA